MRVMLPRNLGHLNLSGAAIESPHGVAPRLAAGRRMRDHLRFMVCCSEDRRAGSFEQCEQRQ